MMGLTAQQSRLLGFMQEQASSGIAPTYAEMAEHMGLASKSGICRIIYALEERGAIRRLSNRARAIEVVERRCPHCGGAL
jgi:repressor LexA